MSSWLQANIWSLKCLSITFIVFIFRSILFVHGRLYKLINSVTKQTVWTYPSLYLKIAQNMFLQVITFSMIVIIHEYIIFLKPFPMSKNKNTVYPTLLFLKWVFHLNLNLNKTGKVRKHLICYIFVYLGFIWRYRCLEESQKVLNHLCDVLYVESGPRYYS